VCQVVKGCTTPANVADHIRPVHPGMPDAEFFSLGNLRASCRKHNIARGFAAQLDGTDAAPSAILTGDLS
jgi:hypothetical protein